MDEFAPKAFKFDDECKDKLISGAQKVYDAVGKTMGPKGELVCFSHPGSVYPYTTKDGVTVASMISLADKFENMGAMMLIQAARKQVREAGDGTTLTTVLAYELLRKGIQKIREGYNPVEIRKGIDRAVDDVIREINRQSRAVDTIETIRSVATIATNNDAALGTLIADAVYKTGEFGEVACINSEDDTHSVQFTDGYQWDNCIEFREFANYQGKCMSLDKPYVLVTSKVMSNASDLVNIIKLIKEECDILETPGLMTINKPLVIIAPDMQGDTMSAMVRNINDKKMFVTTIKPSGGFGTRERMYALEDIAAITGATHISDECGIRFKDIKLEHLGTCQCIISYPQTRKTIIKNADETGNADDRIEYLKKFIEETEDKLEKKYAKTSLAKLLGGMATIKVGGNSESERNEIKDRVDDAILACKSSRELGIVKGGGVALLVAKRTLMDRAKIINNPGYDIVIDAISHPAEKILLNAKRDDTHMIIQEILDGHSNGYNINNTLGVFRYNKVTELWIKLKKKYTKTYDYNDMYDLDIIDPSKVIINGLKNAASIAMMMLQTGVLITNKEK